MDRFAKNFIIMSIVYLLAASVVGILMLHKAEYVSLRFVHSHLMLLGWVSMMIYGVGYHILPRFLGQVLKHKGVAELQFWLANAGLVGMVGFYTLDAVSEGPAKYTTLTVVFGALEAVSIALFFYNMLATFTAKAPE